MNPLGMTGLLAADQDVLWCSAALSSSAASASAMRVSAATSTDRVKA
jgi:hypothetical protein